MTSSRRLLRCPACTADHAALRRREPWPNVDLWRCQGCGTEFLDPQPTDARLGQIYGDTYFEPWREESPEVVRRMKQATMAPILDALDLQAGQSVLDVGCATGELAALAAEQGFKAFGVDLNESAIATARMSVPEARFETGTLADLPFEGETFDAVTMIDFIEHVRQPERELDQISHRLAPDGRIALSTPRIDSLARRVTGSGWPQYREEHITYFSLAGMHALLQRTGYAVIGVWPTRKVLTPAYLYGQAVAYPVPLLTPILRAVWPVAPVPKHHPFRVRLGEMTVIARRRRP